ncbi:alpha-amylase family glycosyl hydrolase [Silanimonas sp.]|jgi:glycosidase|uniref:alpha-amylase family glycosyl hydrolase n=1 Tax=Silanimonas sp. TaxID=1929290 RepID=UPI0037C8B49D
MADEPLPFAPTDAHRAASAAAADAARHAPSPAPGPATPEWAKDAVIYQINTRQFTPEGTFTAAQGQLPRLKALGVDILWLMPIHPIGVEHRKGPLGSPYSVRDYFGVNPEFGTEADLRAFVAAAHAEGMKVILDWVPNHSAWDNPLRTEHPDWYKRDWKGDFRPTPWWDWSDIIELDYSQPGLRAYMQAALRHWVVDVGIDGFRMDVAGFVPLDFWEQVRRELDAVRSAAQGGVFLLAEWESRDLHDHAFDASYAWSWYDAVHRIAHGKADTNALHVYYSWNENFWPAHALRMTFTSNHDKNSWEGTEFEAFGEALPAAMVLSFVGEGIPLVYNGQEAAYDKRIEFFERDPIVWREHPMADFYRRLIDLRTANTALHAGRWGARMVHVPSDRQGKVLSFVRQNGRDKVFAVFNFSAEAQTVHFHDGPQAGDYTDWESGKRITVREGEPMTLPAWGWKVFIGTRPAPAQRG